MQRLFVLAFIIFCMFGSCEEPSQPQFLYPYNWKDSIINYTLTHDSLVLTFPKEPDCKKWYLEIWVPFDTLNKISSGTIPVFEVVNNKVIVPVAIPDSVSTDSIYVWLRAAAADGFHFSKAKSGYNIFEPPRYLADSGVQRAHRSVGQMDLYIIPDSLLHGKNSTYYNLQLLRFMKDSLFLPDPLPASLNQQLLHDYYDQ